MTAGCQSCNWRTRYPRRCIETDGWDVLCVDQCATVSGARHRRADAALSSGFVASYPARRARVCDMRGRVVVNGYHRASSCGPLSGCSE
jgi:hypothetical protein